MSLLLYIILHPPRSSISPYTTLFRSGVVVALVFPVHVRRAVVLSLAVVRRRVGLAVTVRGSVSPLLAVPALVAVPLVSAIALDRKSTRLNSSHMLISYAVFFLKKKRI